MREILAFTALVAGFFLIVLPFVVWHPYVIRSGSMENTLLPGDHILAQRFPTPKFGRGDLVVMKTPVDRALIVKRIAGVSGDRLRMSNKRLYLNNVECIEPYVIHSFNEIDTYRDNLPPGGRYDLAALPESYQMRVNEMLKNNRKNGEIVVPPGKYFVLGDNRDNSLDSRFFGLVDASDVIAKPFLIYDSVEETRDENGRVSARKTRLERILKAL